MATRRRQCASGPPSCIWHVLSGLPRASASTAHACAIRDSERPLEASTDWSEPRHNLISLWIQVISLSLTHTRTHTHRVERATLVRGKRENHTREGNSVSMLFIVEVNARQTWRGGLTHTTQTFISFSMATILSSLAMTTLAGTLLIRNVRWSCHLWGSYSP